MAARTHTPVSPRTIRGHKGPLSRLLLRCQAPSPLGKPNLCGYDPVSSRDRRGVRHVH